MKYHVQPEQLYAGSEYTCKRQNPGIELPKKWQFLKVETVLKRSKKFKPGDVPRLDDPKKVTEFAADVLKELEISDRERMYSIFMDSNLQVIGIHEVTVGSVNASMAPPKELFRAAILANASAIVVVHNHPSGNLTFSQADLLVLRRIEQVAKLLEVQLLDFMVIGVDGQYASANEQGRMGIV